MSLVAALARSVAATGPLLRPRTLSIHYLAPTVLVAILLVAGFLLRKKRPLQRLARITGTVAPAVVPRLLAATTFLAGAILLFSGATPALAGRLRWVERILPLPVVEVSHFFGSLAGAGLLVLARGIQRRLDAAYQVALALLAAGALFSLLKEFDYEEALILLAMLGALVASRRYFYRKASLGQERFTPAWIAAILLVVLGSIVLGYLSYGRPALDTGRFWDFSARAQAPRFLRASAGVLAMLVLLAAARLFRPARPRRAPPRAEDLERARPAVEAHPQAAANLVYLGDKQLLFGSDGAGFVMYDIAGRSWVAMGDPVSPPEQVPELAQRFVHLCDQHGGWAVFYKIGRDQLYRYLDLGFTVVKLGEEARVRLDTFSLEGAERSSLRRLWRRAARDGCSFEVLMPGALDAALPELRTVSDDWIRTKKAREKRFSLGRFDEDYVRRFPTGVVRVGGRVAAFATVWPSGGHEEIEVDLMRFAATAPPGVMRYALVEFMLWGQAQGFRWFNLGMAPLSGLYESRIAPLWNRIGRTVFGHGERFYNFQGLREFKEFFHPVWEPRYLASPAGAPRTVILANVASLIAGGIEGVVRK